MSYTPTAVVILPWHTFIAALNIYRSYTCIWKHWTKDKLPMQKHVKLMSYNANVTLFDLLSLTASFTTDSTTAVTSHTNTRAMTSCSNYLTLNSLGDMLSLFRSYQRCNDLCPSVLKDIMCALCFFVLSGSILILCLFVYTCIYLVGYIVLKKWSEKYSDLLLEYTVI